MLVFLAQQGAWQRDKGIQLADGHGRDRTAGITCLTMPSVPGAELWELIWVEAVLELRWSRAKLEFEGLAMSIPPSQEVTTIERTIYI